MVLSHRDSNKGDASRGKDKRLYWAIGKNDPRTDRGEERRQIVWISLILLVLQVVLGLGLSFVIEPGTIWNLLMVFLGMWAIAGCVLVAAYVQRRWISFEVLTIVKLSPGETSDRLEEALAKKGIDFDKIERRPWLHGEQARFKVRMDSRVEALLLVSLWFQSYDGPTKIILRSAHRRNDWWDLRSVVEEAFGELAVEAPIEDVEMVKENDQ